ncbi:hypothetical protein LINPERPRIM_LOCUS11816 [Linum perenne]
MISASTICEYDLGGEGDLFKAPELIIQDPVLSMDPMTAAISMISCGEDVLTPSGGLKIGDDTVQNEQLLSDVFYECKKDLMEMAAVMEGGDNQKFSDVLLDIKTLPPLRIEENQVMQELVPDDVGLSKSVSSGCLSGMDWIPGASVKQPSFLDFPGIDFTSAYGMRRAFSEGDIKVRNRIRPPLFLVIIIIMLSCQPVLVPKVGQLYICVLHGSISGEIGPH